MYLTYQEHIQLNGKEMEEAEFTRYEREARAIIDFYTLDKLLDVDKLPKELKEKLKNCTEALISFASQIDEALTSNENKVVTSEKVGDYSVSYQDTRGLLGLKTGANYGKTREQHEYDIVCRYLMTTGLLYRGISYVL